MLAAVVAAGVFLLHVHLQAAANGRFDERAWALLGSRGAGCHFFSGTCLVDEVGSGGVMDGRKLGRSLWARVPMQLGESQDSGAECTAGSLPVQHVFLLLGAILAYIFGAGVVYGRGIRRLQERSKSIPRPFMPLRSHEIRSRAHLAMVLNRINREAAYAGQFHPLMRRDDGESPHSSQQADRGDDMGTAMSGSRMSAASLGRGASAFDGSRPVPASDGTYHQDRWTGARGRGGYMQQDEVHADDNPRSRWRNSTIADDKDSGGVRGLFGRVRGLWRDASASSLLSSERRDMVSRAERKVTEAELVLLGNAASREASPRTDMFGSPLTLQKRDSSSAFSPARALKDRSGGRRMSLSAHRGVHSAVLSSHVMMTPRALTSAQLTNRQNGAVSGNGMLEESPSGHSLFVHARAGDDGDRVFDRTPSARGSRDGDSGPSSGNGSGLLSGTKSTLKDTMDSFSTSQKQTRGRLPLRFQRVRPDEWALAFVTETPPLSGLQGWARVADQGFIELKSHVARSWEVLEAEAVKRGGRGCAKPYWCPVHVYVMQLAVAFDIEFGRIAAYLRTYSVARWSYVSMSPREFETAVEVLTGMIKKIRFFAPASADVDDGDGMPFQRHDGSHGAMISPAQAMRSSAGMIDAFGPSEGSEAGESMETSDSGQRLKKMRRIKRRYSRRYRVTVQESATSSDNGDDDGTDSKDNLQDVSARSVPAGNKARRRLSLVASKFVGRRKGEGTRREEPQLESSDSYAQQERVTSVEKDALVSCPILQLSSSDDDVEMNDDVIDGVLRAHARKMSDAVSNKLRQMMPFKRRGNQAEEGPEQDASFTGSRGVLSGPLADDGEMEELEDCVPIALSPIHEDVTKAFGKLGDSCASPVDEDSEAVHRTGFIPESDPDIDEIFSNGTRSASWDKREGSVPLELDMNSISGISDVF